MLSYLTFRLKWLTESSRIRAVSPHSLCTCCGSPDTSSWAVQPHRNSGYFYQPKRFPWTRWARPKRLHSWPRHTNKFGTKKHKNNCEVRPSAAAMFARICALALMVRWPDALFVQFEKCYQSLLKYPPSVNYSIFLFFPPFFFWEKMSSCFDSYWLCADIIGT